MARFCAAAPARNEPARVDVAGAGVDLHNDAVHQLMQQFRLVPEARLDDLMISYATDGGG